MFRNPKNFPEMADPLLKKNFPEKDLNQAVAIAAMCLQEEEGARPLMSDVVTALSFLSVVPPEVIPAPVSPANQPPEEGESSGSETGGESNREEDDYGSEEEEEESDEEGQDSDASGSKEFYSKSSRKSSKKSRNGSGSEGSQKSSGKSHSLSQKSSKKTPERDAKQKRSRKTSGKELSQRSGRKSSGRVISRKRSTGSEEGGSSRMSQGDISFGLISSGSGESVYSDHSCGRRSTEGMARLDHAQTAKQPHKDHRREVLTAASAKV